MFFTKSSTWKKWAAAVALSLTAGTTNAGLLCDGCLGGDDDSRPWYDPSCEPNWGYHQTQWRRFPGSMNNQGMYCPTGGCQPQGMGAVISSQPMPMSTTIVNPPSASQPMLVQPPPMSTLSIPSAGGAAVLDQSQATQFFAPAEAVPNVTNDQILAPRPGGAPAAGNLPMPATDGTGNVPLPRPNSHQMPPLPGNGGTGGGAGSGGLMPMPPMPGQSSYYQSPSQQYQYPAMGAPAVGMPVGGVPTAYNTGNLRATQTGYQQFVPQQPSAAKPRSVFSSLTRIWQR